ncbi:catalase family peroxidase [Shewanella aestuarii]|uniref:Catalase-related peroxidase n=1 Tax=Shewanella aestuarii TaxID=1028752 RepID=A0A6G9QMM3_9GAMM|nr:catalase family peroxidase [Shewanella aestuarii]QIR15343.1 catalase family peroxidase [Shewanella aestuarii]
MQTRTLSMLIKASLFTALPMLTLPTEAAQKTISELVDAVNGTPDELSRDAGKKVKLRNHANGFCTSGVFKPNPQATDAFAIPFFTQANIDIIARFSLGGINPLSSDKTTGRFMSLKLNGDNESLHFVTSNAEVFFASNLDDFFTFQTKIKQGNEGKQWLIDNKPDTKAFFDYVKKLPSTISYADNRYFGVNSFIFTSKNGESVAGRWIFEPVNGVRAVSANELAQKPDHFLQQELTERIASTPATWDLFVQLAEEQDKVNDPTIVWPTSRKRLLIGQVIINGQHDDSKATLECDKGIFNPLQLPKGISPSADPILNARSAAYIESFIRRN